jgi:hypothetical protein
MALTHISQNFSPLDLENNRVKKLCILGTQQNACTQKEGEQTNLDLHLFGLHSFVSNVKWTASEFAFILAPALLTKLVIFGVCLDSRWRRKLLAAVFESSAHFGNGF